MCAGLTAWTDGVWLLGPARRATTVLTDPGGRIVAVGDDGLCASAAHVESLGGRVASAGLWDSHLHWLALAEQASQLDLTGATSLRDLYQRVQVASAVLPPDQVLMGAGWNQNRWGGEWPDRTGLDHVAPGRPVVLWARDHHGLVANSVAFSRLWPDGEPVDPPGGRYERRHGALTGIVRETAANELAGRLPAMPVEALLERLPALVERLLRFGLVGATGMEPERVCGALEAHLRQTQTFRSQVFLTDDEPGWTSPSSPWFRVVGAKRFLDGALGTRTAAVARPYADGSGEGVWRIARDRVPGELAEAAADGAAAVAVHAIGDAAVAAALDAFAHLPVARSGVAHRVEHAQLMDPASVARMGHIPGIVASMQPVHLLDDRWAMQEAWPDRLEWSFPLASLAAAGVPVLLGSDAPIETPDPAVGMQAAVWRARAGEPAWQPQEAVTPWQALGGYTSAAAAADQRIGGVLAVGRWADFTVYDRDPLEALAHREPFSTVGTVVGGRWAYRAF